MSAAVAKPPRRLHRHLLRLFMGLALSLIAWGLAAYFILPILWTHHEHQPGLAAKPMETRTGQGIPGDPINVGLVGNKTEILQAMAKAGWNPADVVTFGSSVRIGTSVLFNRAYLTAPISPLFYDGHRQALAFQKPVGTSAKRRHHVRFWPSLEKGAEGRPVWLGAISFDRSVGLSHYTGQITHHVGPDLDAERNLMIDDLTRAGALKTIYLVTGIGPTTDGRNGGGDHYFTDGEVKIGVLTQDNRTATVAPEILAEPTPVVAKNGIWHATLDVARWLHIVPKAAQANAPP